MDCNDCRKDEMKMDLIWNAIATEEDISNLNNLYGYFEDSVIVSMNYISGNSINDEFVESECLKWRVIKANMIKTLIYFPPEYKNLALKIRENYIEHHHGKVDLVSETDQNDIEYARKEKYDEAIFIENIDSVVIHYIKSGYTNRCSISDVCYSGK